MSRFFNILVGMAICLPTGRACAQMADEIPPVRAEFAYASSEVFRGAERTGAAGQTTVEFANVNFRLGAGYIQPFDAGDPRVFNLTAGYTWRPAERLVLGAVLAHSWFNHVPGVDRSIEAGLLLGGGEMGGFTPTLAYYRDFRFDADTVEVSLARSIALTKLGAFLELHLSAGLVHGENWRPDLAGPRRRDGYGYWGGEVELPYRVGPHSLVVGGIHYADSFGRSLANGPFARSAKGNLWVTLGVNLEF